MMVGQFVVPFLVHVIFRETLTEMGITISVLLQKKKKAKSTTIFLGLYSYGPQKRHQNFTNFPVKPLAYGSWFHLLSIC